MQSNQNLVYYLSCNTAYVHFCSGRMLKGLGLGIYGLGLDGPGLGVKILALITSLFRIIVVVLISRISRRQLMLLKVEFRWVSSLSLLCRFLAH